MLFFFFFNDTATTEIYTLSLHDALPIFTRPALWLGAAVAVGGLLAFAALVALSYGTPFVVAERLLLGGAVFLAGRFLVVALHEDRKSTRLNSSHANISYAVFCLKKKKNY